MGREGRVHLEDCREDLRWDWDEVEPGRNWEIIGLEHLFSSLIN